MNDIIHKTNEENWQLKRASILKRDNYTCQCCRTFNPELGIVEIYREDGMYVELHKYESSPRSSTYTLSSEKTGLTISMEFGEDWLVLPVMQVHHKRYIENRQEWNYEDSDLVTLCKKCHTLIHNNISIPRFDENGRLLSKKKYLPIDEGSGRSHNIQPWNFIRFKYEIVKQREYLVTDVQPILSFFMADLDKKGYFEKEEVLEKSTVPFSMFEDFMKRFLPNYKPDYKIV